MYMKLIKIFMASFFQPRLFGTRLFGTRLFGTRLFGTPESKLSLGAHYLLCEYFFRSECTYPYTCVHILICVYTSFFVCTSLGISKFHKSIYEALVQLLLYGDNYLSHELSITLLQLKFCFVYEAGRFG